MNRFDPNSSMRRQRTALSEDGYTACTNQSAAEDHTSHESDPTYMFYSSNQLPAPAEPEYKAAQWRRERDAALRHANRPLRRRRRNWLPFATFTRSTLAFGAFSGAAITLFGWPLFPSGVVVFLIWAAAVLLIQQL